MRERRGETKREREREISSYENLALHSMSRIKICVPVRYNRTSNIVFPEPFLFPSRL